MHLNEFQYDLPPELIAQTPLAKRDDSRLMVIHRETGQIEHRLFHEIGAYIDVGDILVANDSRVLPARLFGKKLGPDGTAGAKVEILLLREEADDLWETLVGGRRLRKGVRIQLDDSSGASSEVVAEIIEQRDGPLRAIKFSVPIRSALDRLGHIPLPPYIHQQVKDGERYQTIYSRHEGSAAAPTAGLHFTPDLLLSLRDDGVRFETGTLHVGLDTFQPVKVDQIEAHHIHSEWAMLSTEAAKRINETKLAGGRIIAVGTTSVRILETAALRAAGINDSLQTISARDAAGETANMCPWKPAAAFATPTDLYIYPGYVYRAVDALITNFHLPGSTLLMLVAAFAGKELMFHAYETAIQERYRFFSFGDAMLIL